LAGAPEEVNAELPGMDSASAVAARQRLEARAAAEEELMLRVPLSKAEAKKLRAQRRCVLSGREGRGHTRVCVCVHLGHIAGGVGGDRHIRACTWGKVCSGWDVRDPHTACRHT
jgi:hypothetical protein